MSFRMVVSLVTPLLISTLAAPAFAEETTAPAHPKRTASHAHHACLSPAVDITDGHTDEHIALTTCSGAPAPLAVERLSILARPENTPKPTKSALALSKVKGPVLAPGIRRLDVGLIERLEQVVHHFSDAAQSPKVTVMMGHKPTSHGNHHQQGRALDFHLDGVSNDDVVAFCKTLADTGCGYYPNGDFIHLDVREPGSGHVAWIDTSIPGEHPHYVASWPIQEETKVSDSTPARSLSTHDPLHASPVDPAHAPLRRLPSPDESLKPVPIDLVTPATHSSRPMM